MTDPRLPVLPDLPPDAFEARPRDAMHSLGMLGARRHASPYHHCRACGGWVEGHPDERREHSLGPLSGRWGTSFHCRRCGGEIGFSGMMS